MADAPVKEGAVSAFGSQKIDALSDPIDCSRVNAVSLQIIRRGGTADLKLHGAPQQPGPYIALEDPAATITGISVSQIKDVNVGAAWLKVELLNIAGDLSAGGFAVKVTPYKSPGPTSLTAVVS